MEFEEWYQNVRKHEAFYLNYSIKVLLRLAWNAGWHRGYEIGFEGKPIEYVTTDNE